MRVWEEEVDAYVSCSDIYDCLWGTAQRQTKVRAIRRTEERTFRDRQGRDDLSPNPTADNPLASMVEHSQSYLTLAEQDLDKMPCPGCGTDRSHTLTEQIRPTYINLSGQPQIELIKRRKEAKELEAEFERELFTPPEPEPEPTPEPKKPAAKDAA